MFALLPVAMLLGAASAVNIGGKGKTAFLIVDVQDCFLPNGSLGVSGSDQILEKIQQIYNDKACLFDLVVRSQDFHPPGHISFASVHGLPPFADLTLGKGELPITCVAAADGNIQDASCCPSYFLNPSEFNCSEVLCPGDGNGFMYNASDSIITGNPACTICNATPAQCFNTTQRMWTDHCEFDGDSDLELDIPSELIQKGNNKFVDAYSAFADNTNNLQTPLDDVLQGKGIETLFIAGIATDVVVDYTVRDAVTRGYKVVVVGDATAGISPQTEADALEAFAALDGVQVVNTTDVMDFPCSKKWFPWKPFRRFFPRFRRNGYYGQSQETVAAFGTDAEPARHESESDTVHFMQEVRGHQDL